jgi:hypothetical protein
MTEEQQEELDRGERAGRLIVAHMKRMQVSGIMMPVLDDSDMWLVSVERVRILENEGA